MKKLQMKGVSFITWQNYFYGVQVKILLNIKHMRGEGTWCWKLNIFNCWYYYIAYLRTFQYTLMHKNIISCTFDCFFTIFRVNFLWICFLISLIYKICKKCFLLIHSEYIICSRNSKIFSFSVNICTECTAIVHLGCDHEQTTEIVMRFKRYHSLTIQ